MNCQKATIPRKKVTCNICGDLQMKSRRPTATNKQLVDQCLTSTEVGDYRLIGYTVDQDSDTVRECNISHGSCSSSRQNKFSLCLNAALWNQSYQRSQNTVVGGDRGLSSLLLRPSPREPMNSQACSPLQLHYWRYLESQLEMQLAARTPIEKELGRQDQERPVGCLLTSRDAGVPG